MLSEGKGGAGIEVRLEIDPILVMFQLVMKLDRRSPMLVRGEYC